MCRAQEVQAKASIAEIEVCKAFSQIPIRATKTR